MAEKREFQILSSTPYAWLNAKRELVQSNFIVYRDEEGRVGTIVIQKPKPTVADVKAEIEKRRRGILPP